MPPLLHIDRDPDRLLVRCLGIPVLLVTTTLPPAAPVPPAPEVEGPWEDAGEVVDSVLKLTRRPWWSWPGRS